jgi:hypothetical protein
MKEGTMMRKLLLVGGVVLALLGASVVVTQAAGPWFGPRGGPGAIAGGPRGGPGGGIPADVVSSLQTAAFSGVAKVLGMPPDALRQELASGTTIWAIAEAKNVSPADLQAAAVTARRAAINQALSAGTITQDQANRLLQVGPARGFGFGRGVGFGPGAGPGVGFRRSFGWGPGGPFPPGFPR